MEMAPVPNLSIPTLHLYADVVAGCGFRSRFGLSPSSTAVDQALYLSRFDICGLLHAVDSAAGSIESSFASFS